MDPMLFANWSPLFGVLGLVVAFVLFTYLSRQSTGNEVMRGIAQSIHEGAMAFLRREYTVIAGFVVIVTGLLFITIGKETAIAFVTGALSSTLAGFFGMAAATRANVRTAAAAMESGSGKALRIAFFGGAVMGLSVAAIGLLGIGGWYY